METQTTTVPGRSKTTIRTRYDSDLDGHLQAMEREVQEFDYSECLDQADHVHPFPAPRHVFVPIQKTVTVETRKESGVIDVQSTVSLRDQSGQIHPDAGDAQRGGANTRQQYKNKRRARYSIRRGHDSRRGTDVGRSAYRNSRNGRTPKVRSTASQKPPRCFLLESLRTASCT